MRFNTKKIAKQLARSIFLSGLFLTPNLYAQLPVSQMPEETTPVAADLLYLVKTPGGAGTSRKVTVTNLTKGLNAASITDQGIITTGTQTFAGIKTFTGDLTTPSLTMGSTFLWDKTNDRLRLIDTTGTDSNLFTTGIKGIYLKGGTSDDIRILSVSDKSSNPILSNYVHNNAATASISYNGLRSRGASSSATLLQNGDDILNITAKSWGSGVTYETAARILMESDGTPSATSAPGRINFITVKDGTTFSSDTTNERMSIRNDGSVIINEPSSNGTTFRVESDTDANLICTDGPNDRLGIGTATPTAKLDVTQTTIGNAITALVSTTTNDDPTVTTSQNRVATTDATVTTLHTVAITASRTYKIKAEVIARRTGGSAGTADDGASYTREWAFTTKAGVVTQLGADGTIFTAEDQAGWNVTAAVSGTNVLIQVTGATNNNVTWHLMKCEVSSVGS